MPTQRSGKHYERGIDMVACSGRRTKACDEQGSKPSVSHSLLKGCSLREVSSRFKKLGASLPSSPLRDGFHPQGAASILMFAHLRSSRVARPPNLPKSSAFRDGGTRSVVSERCFSTASGAHSLSCSTSYRCSNLLIDSKATVATSGL